MKVVSRSPMLLSQSKIKKVSELKSVYIYPKLLFRLEINAADLEGSLPISNRNSRNIKRIASYEITTTVFPKLNQSNKDERRNLCFT